MPQIPTIVSKETYGGVDPLNRSFSRVTATSDMFGGQVGKATSAFGNAIGEAAESALKVDEELRTRKRAEDVANAIAQTNLTQPALEAQLNAPSDGSGVVKQTYESQRALIDQTAAAKFPGDARAAAAYKQHMYGTMNHYTTQATTFEFKQAAEHSKLQADTSLSELGNKTRVDPTFYPLAVEQGNLVIDNTPNVPAYAKENMKRAWAEQAANTRFEGMLTSAKTVDDLKLIEAELTGKGGTIPAKGLTAPGNIDIYNRPVAKNADGSVSTVRSITIGEDNQTVIIPTVIDGKVVSNDEAKAHYKTTGEHLGKFESDKDAEAYAQALHKQQEAQYANPWMKTLSPKDFESLIKHIESGKKVFQTKADTDARTAVETLEGRSKDGIVIPAEELRTTQNLVAESKNTLTMTRLYRVVRDQQLLTQTRGLPPAELQAKANEAKGGAGMQYPNLPPEVSQHISEATAAFPNVSASYLGGTAVREYGANFPARTSKGNVQFTPVPAREDVNLNNVRPAIKDALTVAGQVYGEPLTITSGYRSQQKQDAIRFSGDPSRPGVASHSHHTEGSAVDISTVGKSAEQKAKMVDALVQAGFTGFGEYDTHIHADMRANVPNSYDAGWGGWTRLTPEVQSTLSKRGFKAGASAAEIDRTGPAASIMSATAPAAVDYGKGTGITKNGVPTSSAVGLYQFTKGTWGDYSDPTKNADTVAAVKAVTGVDFTGMTPEQRLAYRADPRVSTVMAAALASKNKTALEATMQRPINDAELYMAHLFGPTGAVALLRNYTANGDTPAVSVLPDAAASNKPIFYTKDGRAKSVKQVYDSITGQFLAAPTQVGYGDAQTYQRLHDNAVKQIKENPIGYAQQQGTQTVIPLTDPNGWQARGAAFNNVGKYFQIAKEDNKPFDAATELPALEKQFKDGTPEDVVALLQNMAKMDGTGQGSFTAGLKQLGKKDTSYDVAGQLASSDIPTATTIIRGEKRMDADKSSKALLGEEHVARDTFNKTTGTALYAMAPEAREAIRSAAYAHYVETAAMSGTEAFDKGVFEKSINAVMGGRDTPRIGSVNGATTVLPKGVDQRAMEKAVDNLSPPDLIALSVDRTGAPRSAPPMYTSGQPVPVADIATQGKLRYVGADVYQVQMGDGKYLVTAQREQGGFTPYLMKIDKPTVDRLTRGANTRLPMGPTEAIIP